MAEKGDSRASDLYQGGYSSFSPKYGNIMNEKYRINPRSLGMSTDPRTANVLQEASSKLNAGVKQIEISAVTPQIFDAIPKQQLKELNRLSKLTGVDISLHGPIVEPSGLSDNGFSESNRESSERMMFSAIERGHEINPSGNIPVTFHSSAVGIPGKFPEKAKGNRPEETMIINTESGSIHKLPLKERHFPGEENKKDAKTEINKLNERQWTENLEQLRYHSTMGKEAIDESMATKIISDAEKKAGKEITKNEEAMRSQFNRGALFLNSSYNELTELFSTAWQKSSPIERGKIENFYREIDEKAKKIKSNPSNEESIALRKEIIDKGVELLSKVSPPQTYKDLNDYAKEKTVETFSNVAFNAYKKFGDKSPIISVENPPAGAIFSTGEELRDVINNARDKFVEKAVKEGINKEDARKAAEKLLGVTWDVGHINMLKKFGYENKDIVKESEKVAPLVKHVHLSDNFGFEHTELPMGMGNVPMKEIMDKLGKEGFDAKKIIEAASWWEHFKAPPFKETLESFGSPIYGMEMGPYWNQSLGFQQNYNSGYGMVLPQNNYETFGAGFSRLPTELGGQRPGAEGSRMSGRGME
ncbi:Xylose isomerase-like TIM barrel [uncultured archaeon]|nr:Xylose isomerase-like TIM barrel [uncultured archaeon]